MSFTTPRELCYITTGVSNRNIYDKDNNWIGEYTGFSSAPTTSSTGHIEINTPDGKFWVSGKGVYIEGMGIKITEDICFRPLGGILASYSS